MLASRPTVTLLDGENISTVWLTRRIAEAILPDLEKCEGLSCVMGMEKSSDAGSFPFKLGKADIEALEPLFAELPKVHACMSDTELLEFLSAYDQHPKKPNGTPYFASQSDVDRRKAEIQSLDDSHQDALRAKVKAGELHVFDHLHRPTDSLGYNVYISRLSAEKYLASINVLAMSQVQHNTSLGSPERFSAAEQPLDFEKRAEASDQLETNSESENNSQTKGSVRPNDVDLNASQAGAPKIAGTSDGTEEAVPLKDIGTGVIRHSLDDETPYIPVGTKGIVRVAMRAAWRIREESNKRASDTEVMKKMGEWFLSKSSEAEDLIKSFDEKTMELYWYSSNRPGGKLFKVKGCKRAIALWEKEYAENCPK